MSEHLRATGRGRSGRTIGPWLVAALFAFAASGPLAAEPAAQDDRRWKLSVFTGGVASAGDSAPIAKILPDDTLPGPARQSVGDGTGFGLALERRLTRRFGLELTAIIAELDTDYRLDLAGSTLSDREPFDFESLQLALLYHFRPERRLDVHAGALFGIVYYNDITFLTEAGRRDKFAFDDDTAIGVKAGLDYRLTDGGRWSVTAEVRYLAAIVESEFSGQDLDLEPLLVSAGLGYRF